MPVNGRKFAGSESARNGINGLAVAEDVTMVIVPDLITACTKDDGSIDLNLWKAVQTALISHCEQNGNRMAVLDAPPGMNPQQIKEWRSDVAMYDSAYAALYYPWIKVENPIGVNGNAEVFIPPSGHVAGVWARTDETRGVWKAPANDTIRGVLDIERTITQNEQGLLNPIGINCIRPFGTRGIRIWGARTLSSDTDWRYINVRRLFNMIEATILEGTQYAVFEPNDMTLWEGVKRTLNGFLRGLWTAGALFGATADQAFYVKCDAETNPPESIDEGKLVVEVGIAPVKPAEFVVFRISQQKQTSGLICRSHEKAGVKQCPMTFSRPTRSSPRTSSWRLPARTSCSPVSPASTWRSRSREIQQVRQGRQAADDQDPRRRAQGSGPLGHPDGPAGRDSRPDLEVVPRDPRHRLRRRDPHHQPQERLDRALRHRA